MNNTPEQTPTENAARAAYALVHGARHREYGDRWSNFTDLARLWSPIFRLPITPEQVAMCMIQSKLVRLCFRPAHYDSLVDIHGYLLCYREILEYRQGNREKTIRPPGAHTGKPLASTNAFERAEAIAELKTVEYAPWIDYLPAVAETWSVVLATDVQPGQVALALTQLKLAQLLRTPDNDESIRDIHGNLLGFEAVMHQPPTNTTR